MREIFEHTADLGLRVEASSREALHVEAALGLFEIICGDLDQVRPEERETLRVTGTDPTFLLFDWLNELLYRFESGRILFREFQVCISERGLEATVAGERYDNSRHQLAHEVKAITYHGLAVVHDADGWSASIIFDI